MNFLRRAIIFAHYHPRGLVPEYTRILIETLRTACERFVLVSTQLSDSARASLPRYLEVSVRENVGHDFMSYKTGLLELGDWEIYDEVLFVNDSFVTLDPDRLLAVLGTTMLRNEDVWGLTGSHEKGFHLQSYFLGFRKEALAHPAFHRFWADVEVLADKRDIIRRYERGLSDCLKAAGLSLHAVFAVVAWSDIVCMAWRRARGHVLLALFGSAQMLIFPRQRRNPTHYLWDRCLDRLGVVKVELLRTNPKGLCLDELEAQLSAEQKRILALARADWVTKKVS
jgi:lipopolysaccharide biosynthesis protein